MERINIFVCDMFESMDRFQGAKEIDTGKC